MASAKTVKCPLFEDSFITLALFTNVTNASDLRKSVMSGSFQATLINPSVVSNVEVETGAIINSNMTKMFWVFLSCPNIILPQFIATSSAKDIIIYDNSILVFSIRNNSVSN